MSRVQLLDQKLIVGPWIGQRVGSEVDVIIGVLEGEIDGNRWVCLVDDYPPGEPGITIYFSSKTIKKDTYVCNVWHGMASGMARHGITWRGMGWHGIA